MSENKNYPYQREGLELNHKGTVAATFCAQSKQEELNEGTPKELWLEASGRIKSFIEFCEYSKIPYAIISYKYGLVASNEVIDNYDIPKDEVDFEELTELINNRAEELGIKKIGHIGTLAFASKDIRESLESTEPEIVWCDDYDDLYGMFYRQETLPVEEKKLDREVELIHDAEHYNPSDVADDVLLNDHSIGHAWWKMCHEIDDFKYDCSFVKKLHDMIVKEMEKRGFEHNSPLKEVESLSLKDRLGKAGIKATELDEELGEMNDDQLKAQHALSHSRQDKDLHEKVVKEMEDRGMQHNSPLGEEESSDDNNKEGDEESSSTTEQSAEEDAEKSAKQDEIKLMRYFHPLKGIHGYREGEVYSIDNLADFIKEEDYPCVAEAKFDGARCVAFRDNDKVKVYSDGGEDVTHRVPSLVRLLKQDDWPQEICLDSEAEMWVDGKHQGREETSGFLHTDEKAKPGEDKDLVFNIFDCVYFKDERFEKHDINATIGDLHKEPLEIRLKYLDLCPFKQSVIDEPEPGVNQVKSYQCKDFDELKEAVEEVSNAKASEGSLIKFGDSKYPLSGMTQKWIKYKKMAEVHAIALEQIETETEDVFVYKVGLKPVADFDYPKDDKIEINGNEYLYAGKTFNTDLNVDEGTILTMSFHTLFVYEKDNTRRIRLYEPRIIEARPDQEEPDTISDAIEIAENAKLLEKKKLADPTLRIPEEDKKWKFVYHQHARGKSVSDRTPIVIRKDGKISVIPIEELWQSSISGEGTLPVTNTEVWTENSWSNIKYITRHKEERRLSRVNSSSGLVEVTPDHSLFKNNQPVESDSLNVGDKIDHCALPEIGGDKQVDSEYAWMLGFFLAEGFSSPYKNKMWIGFSNSNLEFLYRIQELCKKYGWRNYLYKSTESGYTLVVHGVYLFDCYISPKGYSKSERAAYRKKVPDFVLDWDKDSLHALLDGFLAGDGVGDKLEFAVTSQPLAQGLLLIMKHLYPELVHNVQQWYNLVKVSMISPNHNRTSDRNIIKKILPSLQNVPMRGEVNPNYKHGNFNNSNLLKLEMNEWIFQRNRYVYDIETENHDFMSGVGSIRAHNSVHSDLRMQVSANELVGWTLAEQPEGEIKEDIDTLADMKKVSKEVDWKLVDENKHVVAIKKPLHPKDWLNVEGVIEKGGVGSTKENEGVFYIYDKGNVEYGFQESAFHEYFLNGNKLKGRFIVRKIPARGDTSSTVWNAWFPDDEMPYIISKDAKKDGDYPPKGKSLLPDNIKKKIPDEYKYWNKDNYKEIRDNLVDALDKGDVKLYLIDKYKLTSCDPTPDCEIYLTLPDGTHRIEDLFTGEVQLWEKQGEKFQLKTTSYRLAHHWWKGQTVVREGPSTEHYDLFINDDQVELSDNPLETSEVTAMFNTEPYDISDVEGEIKPGEDGNPTKDTPAHLDTIAEGKAIVYEDNSLFKKYGLFIDNKEQVFILKRDNENTSMWYMSQSKGAPTSMKLSFKGVEKSGDKWIVKGLGLAEGVWNGVYFPSDVIKKSSHLLIGKQADIEHNESLKWGTVRDAKFLQDETALYVEVETKDKEVVNDIQNGEYKGFSIDAWTIPDPRRGIVKEILEYDAITLTESPACSICVIGGGCE